MRLHSTHSVYQHNLQDAHTTPAHRWLSAHQLLCRQHRPLVHIKAANHQLSGLLAACIAWKLGGCIKLCCCLHSRVYKLTGAVT